MMIRYQITVPHSTNNSSQVSKKISHRGPDARATWISDDGGVGTYDVYCSSRNMEPTKASADSTLGKGLGHCRLSINDLSENGNQPIHSDDGEIHGVINGEIYDHDRLRRECIRRGYTFKGHSDSEVVVALYKIYGAPNFLQHLRGEFSFVLYDKRSDKVIAVRDRFGIKPLLWTTLGEGGNHRLLFASEAKAFKGFDWEAEWDLGSLVEGGWLSDERTIFKGVKKLMPGYWMEISKDGTISHRQYWDLTYRDKVRRKSRFLHGIVCGY